MAAHRYWRVKTLRLGGGSFLEISALELYHGASRVDASATISAQTAPSFGAVADLKDGSLSTRPQWAQSVAEDAAFWIRWDFGSATVVDGLKQGGFDTANRYIRDCTVEYSDDDSTWTPLVRLVYLPYPGNNTLSSAYSFPAEGAFGSSYRYWRLVATAVDGSTSYVSASEVELLGFDGSDWTTGLGSSASQTGNGSVGPASALVDNGTGSEGGSSQPLPWTWSIDLGVARQVVAFTLASQRSVPDRTPKDFTLQASANGTSGWKTVLTVTGASGWSAEQTRGWYGLSYVSYSLSGVVKDAAGAFVARDVRAYLRSTGELVATATSNGTTGAYSLPVNAAVPHYVVHLDDAENAVVFDHLTPITS